MPDVVLRAEHVTKRFGGITALENAELELYKGEVHALVGANGAGKSTTMNMMTGYIAATSGTVKINGYDILKNPEQAKKSIGYLPELPPVYPDMTVYEYLRFVAELKKVKKNERQVQIEDVMKQTQIEDVKGRLIKNLSKGYKQRVGLAQAIIGYPEVIILDEPTVGLDPKQIIEIRELIRELAKKHTIILSSHILSEVSAVCDHIMIISKGKLVASDTPEGLMTLLKGGRQMKLSVLGEQSKVEELLRSMESVKDFSMQPPRAEGMVSVNIRTEDTEDIRVELFHRLAAADMPIMELSLSEKSLEDVFLELTGEEDKENEGNI